MRIIAGKLRGRRLETPQGRGTRPMLDRVREAVFSTLAPWLDEARVLDLFAGTGALGLEALSRGAREARFVEAEAGAAKLLERNVRALGLEGVARVVRGDALERGAWGREPADVVFFDPPYPLLREAPSRERVTAALWTLVFDVLAPDGVLVFHAPRRTFDLEPRAGAVVRERDYGSNAIFYVQRDDEVEP